MKKSLMLVSLVGMGVLFSGCSYKQVSGVDYKDFNAYSTAEAGNIGYKSLSPVYATTNGFLWTNCGEMSRAVLKKLESAAKAKGGDGIVNVKWVGDNGNLYDIPTCEYQYGWLIPYILPALGPWTSNAKASAIAVKFTNIKVEDKSKNNKASINIKIDNKQINKEK